MQLAADIARGTKNLSDSWLNEDLWLVRVVPENDITGLHCPPHRGNNYEIDIYSCHVLFSL